MEYKDIDYQQIVDYIYMDLPSKEEKIIEAKMEADEEFSLFIQGLSQFCEETYLSKEAFQVKINEIIASFQSIIFSDSKS